MLIVPKWPMLQKVTDRCPKVTDNLAEISAVGKVGNIIQHEIGMNEVGMLKAQALSGSWKVTFQVRWKDNFPSSF